MAKQNLISKNIAVVGMGSWGVNLVRNFYDLGALHTICDKDSSLGTIVKEKYSGVSFSSNYSSVLDNDNIKAVVISTPVTMHYSMAKAAIEANKDVFVEKPLALDLDEGEHLIELASKKNRILMVGHILRYHPAVSKLKELISDGKLGRIQYIYSNRLNMGKIRTEENILWSFAPHDISTMLALLEEEPSYISCYGGIYLKHDTPDVTMSQFVFPSGVSGHIFVSWLHPFKEQRLVIVGSEKMAVFDDMTKDKLTLYPHKVEWKKRIPTAVKAEAEKVPLEACEPLRVECEHFLECVKHRYKPITDGHEGLSVLKILHACQKALEQNSSFIPKPLQLKKKSYFVHKTAFVDEAAQIGSRTKIWHFSHIMKNVRIGENCVFGQNCNVGCNVVIGNNVKVQNNVSIYTGTEIEDDVFLGPSCVFTNIINPRSQINRHSLYKKIIIRRGATIGANATILCGVEIGRYAFIAAGAVVTRNIPDYALVMGTPARQVGWMSRHGHRLKTPDEDGIMICPESGFRYREVEPGKIRCLDLSEEEPLPKGMTIGKISYEALKSKK